MRKLSSRGHSILEIVIAMLIFTFFLFGVFAMLNFGLKNYRLIDTKSEAQGQAEVALARVANDLISTDISSLVIQTGMDDYMVFETAVNQANSEFQKDGGAPLWQGYILYYTWPRNTASDNKQLIRKFIAHSPRSLAKQMTNTSIYLTTPTSADKIVAKGLTDLTVAVNSDGYIVNISLTINKKFAERRLAYDKDFGDGGNTNLTVITSVMPRNTQK